jgi:hypothetical protein
LDNRKSGTKGFKPAQRAPASFMTFNVAADHVFMETVLRTIDFTSANSKTLNEK